MDYAEVVENILPFAKGENSLLNNSPRVFYWVGAFIDNKMVGCNALMRISKTRARSRSTFVLAEHRRKGIGYKLVTAVMEKATREGFHIIEGHSAIDSLMLKLGWQPTGKEFKSWNGKKWEKTLNAPG